MLDRPMYGVASPMRDRLAQRSFRFSTRRDGGVDSDRTAGERGRDE